MAAAAVISGLLILAVGLDYIGDDQDVHVPRWVIAWIGGLFIGAGLILGLPAWKRSLPAPNGPAWRRDRNWDSRGIGDDSAVRLRAHFLSLLGVALFLVPFHMIWQQMEYDEISSWFDYAFLIWPLMIYTFELILFGSFLHLLWRLFSRLRYGRSKLEFSNFPYHIGRPLEATLRITRRLANTEVQVELRSVQDRVVLRGSGENERQEVQAYALYRERQTIPLDAQASTRIHFALPSDLPATNLREDPAHYWELVVSATRAGPDFQSVFLVPVYT